MLRTLFEEEDTFQTKMGRLSQADEAIMRELVSGKPTLLKHFRRGPFRVDLKIPAYKSSRPTTVDGAHSFTFSHRTISKRIHRGVPENRTYLCKPVGSKIKPYYSGAKWDTNVRDNGSRGVFWVPKGTAVPKGMKVVSRARLQGRITGLKPGSARDRQAYIERPGAIEEKHYGLEASSVGTIHAYQPLRLKFWESVEAYERKGGRVQSSIIAELPHEDEVGMAGRRRIIEAFGTVLSEMNLPWHGVVHTPDTGPGKDLRNYHMHMHYHDRALLGFERNEFIFAEKKSTAPRARDFVRKLRSEFARVNNEELERAGLTRRYDPRTYKKMGIPKEPAEHLGSAAAALERSGIVTEVGKDNCQREWAYRLVQMRCKAQAELSKRIELVMAEQVGFEAGERYDEFLSIQEANLAYVEAAEGYAQAALTAITAQTKRTMAGYRFDDLMMRPKRAAEQGREGAIRSEAAEVVKELARIAKTQTAQHDNAVDRTAKLEADAKRRLDETRDILKAELLIVTQRGGLSEMDGIKKQQADEDKVPAVGLGEPTPLDRQEEKLYRERAKLEKLVDEWRSGAGEAVRDIQVGRRFMQEINPENVALPAMINMESVPDMALMALHQLEGINGRLGELEKDADRRELNRQQKVRVPALGQSQNSINTHDLGPPSAAVSAGLSVAAAETANNVHIDPTEFISLKQAEALGVVVPTLQEMQVDPNSLAGRVKAADQALDVKAIAFINAHPGVMNAIDRAKDTLQVKTDPLVSNRVKVAEGMVNKTGEFVSSIATAAGVAEETAIAIARVAGAAISAASAAIPRAVATAAGRAAPVVIDSLIAVRVYQARQDQREILARTVPWQMETKPFNQVTKRLFSLKRLVTNDGKHIVELYERDKAGMPTHKLIFSTTTNYKLSARTVTTLMHAKIIDDAIKLKIGVPKNVTEALDTERDRIGIERRLRIDKSFFDNTPLIPAFEDPHSDEAQKLLVHVQEMAPAELLAAKTKSASAIAQVSVDVREVGKRPNLSSVNIEIIGRNAHKKRQQLGRGLKLIKQSEISAKKKLKSRAQKPMAKKLSPKSNER